MQNRSTNRSAHGESYYGSIILTDSSQDGRFDDFDDFNVIPVPSLGERPKTFTKKQTEYVDVQVQQVDDPSAINQSPTSSNQYPIVQSQQNSHISRISSSDKEMPLVVLVILISQKSISEIRMKYTNDPQKEKSIYLKSMYEYQNNNITIFIIKTSLEELPNLKVQYQEKEKKLLLFSSKVKIEKPLHGVIIYGEAGLHFTQFTEKNTNIVLQNYCILAAQEHLTKNLRFFKDMELIPQFYHIFKSCFKSNPESNKLIFLQYQPSNMNINTTQFFLYFFYSIFKDSSPEQRIVEYQIANKIEVRKISKILQYRFYRLFKPSNSYKLFLFYVFFQSALAKKIIDASFKELAQWNILNQNEDRMKEVIIKLEDFKECLCTLLGQNSVNNKIIANSKITFFEYATLRVYYAEIMLKTVPVEDINELLIRFIDHLAVKGKNAKGNNENIDLVSFKQRIIALFVVDDQLRAPVNAGELYNKLKVKFRYMPEVGDFFLQALKRYILPQIPQLLIHHYECTIIPLIVKPEVAQENNILLSHFQNEQIKQSEILFILRIWQEMNSEEYNTNVIEFIILKFIAFNPHFDMEILDRFIETFALQIKDTNVSEQCKKSIPIFCEKILSEMREAEMRGKFQNWLKTVRADLK